MYRQQKIWVSARFITSKMVAIYVPINQSLTGLFYPWISWHKNTRYVWKTRCVWSTKEDVFIITTYFIYFLFIFTFDLCSTLTKRTYPPFNVNTSSNIIDFCHSFEHHKKDFGKMKLQISNIEDIPDGVYTDGEAIWIFMRLIFTHYDFVILAIVIHSLALTGIDLKV